jgi:hypothetical protein
MPEAEEYAGLSAHSRRALGASASNSLPCTLGLAGVEDHRDPGDAATAWGLFDTHGRVSNSALAKMIEEGGFVAGESTRCW